MIKGVAMTGGKRTLILGLTGETIDALLKGVKATLIELDDVQELREAPLERVLLTYAQTDHDLMELLAPHLDREASFGGSERE